MTQHMPIADKDKILNKHLTEIIGLYRYKKFNIAEKKSRDLIKKYPKSITVRKILGNVLSAQENYNESIKCFEEILKNNPKDPDSLNNLGSIYVKKLDLKKAINYYKKAIQAHPSFAIAYNNLGNVYKREKNFIEAISSYKKAIKIRPDYAQAFFNLAVSQQELKKYNDAINSCYESLRISPNFQDAHYFLGNLLKKVKKYEDAYSHFGKVESQIAKAQLLECLYFLKKDKKYEKNLNELIKTDKTNIRVAALNTFVSHQNKKPDTYPFRPNPEEIAEVLEIPICELNDPANIRSEVRWINGTPSSGCSYIYQNNLIHGATASMVRQLLDLVGKQIANEATVD